VGTRTGRGGDQKQTQNKPERAGPALRERNLGAQTEAGNCWEPRISIGMRAVNGAL
jgi:hypothetical protein